MAVISTVKAINDALSTDPSLSKIEELSALHADLPSVLVMIAGAGVNLDMDTALAGRVTEQGKVRGRSASVSFETEDPTVTAPASDLGTPEKEYLRPNGEKYFPRKWGTHTDVLVLRKARETGMYALLYGPPGTGKTALAEAAFPEGLYTVLGSGDTEVADLVGGYVQHIRMGKTEIEWVDGPLLKAAEEGKPLLVDEIGLIDPKVLSIMYGLMDGRREYTVTQNPERGTVTSKDGFYVIAATNPKAPGVRISEALVSRFPIQAEMTTDWPLAMEMGVPKKIVNCAQNLNAKAEEGGITWAPQMRELLAYRDLAKVFGQKWAIANLIASAPVNDRGTVKSTFERGMADETITAARI